ncbi:hypothetical protein JR316_0009420 [Psilocybe cubensis]|uniref:Uncharacterized protein n=2 Tax=Psilocybe cubensis TaxID=181762 RepID=A0A8H8CKZ7_PSICU|nr:hypothetical protein JR316_0009420 [Psilocybe cubensis]KAH9478957.1 hypothetical protein JR316_0009420 [Psilocybe cubensis]
MKFTRATLFLISSTFVSTVASTTLIAFNGAACTGIAIGSVSGSAGMCLTFNLTTVKSISYTGLNAGVIQFFVADGHHDWCTNGPQLVLPPASGCATAPQNSNWWGAAIQ